jgi:hypothetical protein
VAGLNSTPRVYPEESCQRGATARTTHGKIVMGEPKLQSHRPSTPPTGAASLAVEWLFPRAHSNSCRGASTVRSQARLSTEGATSSICHALLPPGIISRGVSP